MPPRTINSLPGLCEIWYATPRRGAKSSFVAFHSGVPAGVSVTDARLSSEVNPKNPWVFSVGGGSYSQRMPYVIESLRLACQVSCPYSERFMNSGRRLAVLSCVERINNGAMPVRARFTELKIARKS